VKLPWLIYCRVSTEDQAKEGVSLEAQRRSCEAMALAHGYTVGEVVIDDVSGKDLNRPGIQRVLRAVEARQVAGVIIYKLDRFTRSRRDLDDLLPLFDRCGAALISVSEKLDTSSAMGRFFIAMLGALAQLERETIAERVTMGMRHRRAQGGFTGGRPPAGCRVVKATDHNGKRLEADPATADIVRGAWARILSGSSLSDVAAYLTAAGVPTSYGAQWTANGTRKLLLNPRVVGILVDQETQDRTKATLRGRWAPAHRQGQSGAMVRQSDRAWLLAGVGACHLCGARLNGVSATSGTGKVHFYYRCSKRQRFGKAGCPLPDLRAEPWERAVCLALLDSVRAKGELVPAVIAYAERCRAAAEPLAFEHRRLIMARDKIGAELANLGELAAQGGAVAAGLGRTIAERQARYAEAEAAAAAIQGRLAATTMGADDAEAMATMLSERLTTLMDAEPAEQATILRGSLARAVLFPPPPGKTTGRVQLSLHPPRLPAQEFVSLGPMVEAWGFEPQTCSLRTNRSTN
jgi:site-specific DNA recombinase